MFEIQGAVSTLGEHLVNPDCVADSESATELFYTKQRVFAALPFIVLVVGFLFWYFKGKCNKSPPFFQKRARKADTTNKDKFVVTITSVLYLLYPTLCKNAFGLFDCKDIGGLSYLKKDLETECYQGTHTSMALVFGGGQLVFFVLGLPLLVDYFLRRHKH